MVTWVFEEGTFKPAAKLVKDKAYSILTDYLGTPKEAYDWWANKVWAIELEAYGKVKSCEGWLGTPAEESFIPFRFQGQYHDLETGLYYNRYRYYSPEEGMYVTAQDPIGLNSRVYNLYSYVDNPCSIIDPFGLDWNYFLADSNGNAYYHGRASDNASLKDVANRHSKTVGTDGVRFGSGDKLVKVTPEGTPFDTVRGIEQRGTEENTLLGRKSEKARGNKIAGIEEAKQKKALGRKRLSDADGFLNGRKVSELPALDELEFKNLKCK